MTISRKIFVGNLNYTTTADALRTWLEPAGEITDIHVPLDRETQRPRGFAFVEFAEEAMANKAIESLDGQELEGRALRLSLAREREARGPRRPPSGARPGYRPPGSPPEDEAFATFRGGDNKPKEGRPKGSRRGLRGRKRSL